MQTRAFNAITINSKQGLLIKSSYNKEKLRDEIYYYLNLPQKIASFFPKLINYDKDYSAYTLEYLPYNTLEELILQKNLSVLEGKEILTQLFGILKEIHAIKPSTIGSSRDIVDFYTKKTTQRVAALTKNTFFKELLTKPYIKINGKKYKNFPLLEIPYTKMLKKCTQKDHLVRAIHGDFCFSNILYSSVSRMIKLIDPRGSFATPGIYGHYLYDYAKLMHCLHGGYDFIVNDKFSFIALAMDNFYFAIPNDELVNTLKKLYVNELLDMGVNIEFIYLIEASLFLSMTCLHYENQQRQKVIFLTGLMLLNQVLGGKYAHMY